jgi:hypothetical protein
MCHVCEESYIGIQVVNINTGPMCKICKREGACHIFLAWIHMDLGA